MVLPPIFSASFVESDEATRSVSSLLFILALETLTCYIRQDRNIHGLTMNNEEIKLTLSADDRTCFLKDKVSYLHLFVTIKFFSRFFGLCVNDEKTELFAIGPQKLVREEFFPNILSKEIISNNTKLNIENKCRSSTEFQDSYT